MGNFPEPTSFNGGPRAQDDPGRADGKGDQFRCLVCGWTGRGYSERFAHKRAYPDHFVVVKGHPRFNDPPRQKSEVA